MNRTKEAARKLKKALSARRIAQAYEWQGVPDPYAISGYRDDAIRLEREAEEITQLENTPQIGQGNEAVPVDEYLEQGPGNARRLILRDTLTEPDAVAYEASIDRLDALQAADCLEVGLDAAESIEANNSLEKMLAHQMAALHKMSMTLTARVMNESETQEQVRLVNACSRLMKTYQEGFLALQKVRAGGQQTMLVQHVHVTEGSQAVVTGKVGAKIGG